MTCRRKKMWKIYFWKKGADFFAWWTKIEIELKVDLVFFVECKKYSHFSLHITTHVCITLNNKRQNMYLYMKCSTAVPRLTWFPTTWFHITWCFILVPKNSHNVILVHKKITLWESFCEKNILLKTPITWFSANVIFQKKSQSL